MAKYLQQSEKAVILPEGVAPEYIELLLRAMEQTDSPNSTMNKTSNVMLTLFEKAMLI